MVKCQLQCMTGKIFQVEIDIISKSVIIKAMIDGAFYTIFLICVIFMYDVRVLYVQKYWHTFIYKLLLLQSLHGFVLWFALG